MAKPNNERLMTWGFAAVVVTSFLLGLFPTFSKPVISTVSPLFFTAICALAPFVIFTPLGVSNSRRTQTQKIQQSQISGGKHRRIYGIVLVSSLVGGIVGPLAYFYGLQSTTAADASLLANAEMVFTIVFASLLFHEKLSRVGLIAVILVALGVVIVATNLEFSSTALDFLAPGHLLILLSSLCWGMDNNIITYASERIDVVRFIMFRSSIVWPVLIISAYVAVTFPTNLLEIGKIFLIGIVVFGGALYFNFLALKWLGAIRSTLIFPISSLFGVVAAYLVLHESIGLYQIASVGIIFIGIYLMTRTESVRREYSYDLP